MANAGRWSYGKNVILKDLKRMKYKNLSGTIGEFNPQGKRTINIVIPPEYVESMVADGWRIREKPPLEEGDLPEYLMKVSFSFKGDPTKDPEVWRITGEGSRRRKQRLSAATVGNLDHELITGFTIEMYQAKAPIDKNPGFAAYGKRLFVNVEEDELDLLFADIPESGSEPDLDEVPFN